MAGTLKVGTITTPSGSGTITIPSGVTLSGGGLANTPAFKATISSVQNIPNGTYTKVNYNNEIFDTDSKYDASTSRFTPTISGYYFIQAQARIAIPDDFDYWILIIRKNNVDLQTYSTVNRNYNTVIVSTIDFANTTDYYEIFTYQNHTGSANLNNLADNMKFEAYKLII